MKRNTNLHNRTHPRGTLRLLALLLALILGMSAIGALAEAPEAYAAPAEPEIAEYVCALGGGQAALGEGEAQTLAITKKATKTVNLGTAYQIEVTGKAIKSCKSSAAKVASVTKDGLVTPKKAGSAKITITTTDKKSIALTLKVVDPTAATKVTIGNGKSLSLTVGDTAQLTAAVSPSTANPSVTWKSSKASVASVDANGLVTAKKAGTAKITVTTASKKTATISITVSKYRLDSKRYKYFRKYMSEKEFEKAYAKALEIVTPLMGLSRQDQLYGIASALRYLVDTGYTGYSMSAKHYNDPYGYLVLGVASCAGCVRTTGLCLNILGISYEHVNESKYTHQWARVKVGSEYWICDAYGLYVGPEPGVRKHPVF